MFSAGALHTVQPTQPLFVRVPAFGLLTCRYDYVYGEAVAERLDCSPPTEANRVQSPAGSLPDFREWESCQTMPLISRFPALAPHFALIGSQDLTASGTTADYVSAQSLNDDSSDARVVTRSYAARFSGKSFSTDTDR
ncbi:hypothetical protein PR048_008261 [Dryococelus australis]|uniref:Uncharacterized protein n=1 Tax=Dryococelus australis TaxID=614101 RepID=A0ABQ9HWL3_9NEOP|nr:hypothetical protein PR048_008261 [Dryococelus australis]